MKTRDDSPHVWAALDVADFGQLSPAQQSLVLMRAAQIQHTERRVNFARRATIRNTQSSGFHQHSNAPSTTGGTNEKHEEKQPNPKTSPKPPKFGEPSWTRFIG